MKVICEEKERKRRRMTDVEDRERVNEGEGEKKKGRRCERKESSTGRESGVVFFYCYNVHTGGKKKAIFGKCIESTSIKCIFRLRFIVQEEHEETLSLVRELQLDAAFMFAYRLVLTLLPFFFFFISSWPLALKLFSSFTFFVSARSIIVSLFS